MHQHNIPSPFHALFIVLNDKKSFIYHSHLAGIVQLLHIFSLSYTINANDAIHQNFVCFMGVLIASFFLMLCEVNIAEIFISILGDPLQRYAAAF